MKKTPFKYEQSLNQVFCNRHTESSSQLDSLSNFEIEIVQFSTNRYECLVRVKNTNGREVIFETPQKTFLSKKRFQRVMLSLGNFIWNSTNSEFHHFIKFLFKKNGVGRKIEHLGYQPEGFWVWSNSVLLPDNTTISIASNGVFKHDNLYYYVPCSDIFLKYN